MSISRDRGRLLHGSGIATAALIVAIATFPVAAWYLIGDLTRVPPDLQPSYLVRPPAVPATVVHIAGIVATVLAAGGILVVLDSDRRHVDGRARRRTLMFLLLAAGLIAAYAGRVITAGTIGANIGGGLATMFFLPIAGVLVLIAIVYLVRTRRSEWR